MNKRRLLSLLMLLLFLFASILPVAAISDKTVMIVPVEKTVEKGLAAFIERAFTEAKEENVDIIILEINTPGGSVDAVLDIKTTIMNSPITSVALVKGQAISAGALIALSADHIAMQPGATLGDAEMRIGNERVTDEKLLSNWKKELASAAEAQGRDPEIAMAFADRDMVIEGVIEEGKLLTLTTKEALELGMADYQVQNREELLDLFGLENPRIINADPTTTERIARFLTNPLISPILLTLGIAGLAIEFLTAGGFGIFGLIGLGSLALFFAGFIVLGMSNWTVVLLFILGILLLIGEAFAPGFGILGISGLISIIASIVLVSPSFEAALISLTVALIGTIILVPISFKFLAVRGVWQKLILGSKLGTEEGYVAAKKELADYINKEGVAINTLRPAGTVELEDGTRLDVVSSGDYIPKDSKVRIVKVEGNRIVVQKID
ncbi:MAG: nodulation protein NfeD [Clostridia bacterium]|jgi:membrane-bound serine protease (ClpP class)|nr:nodulation protein NfeD [Clostridia bacterium]